MKKLEVFTVSIYQLVSSYHFSTSHANWQHYVTNSPKDDLFIYCKSGVVSRKKCSKLKILCYIRIYKCIDEISLFRSAITFSTMYLGTLLCIGTLFRELATVSSHRPLLSTFFTVHNKCSKLHLKTDKPLINYQRQNLRHGQLPKISCSFCTHSEP